MKVLRTNTLAPGVRYGMAFYDDKDTITEATLKSRPSCSVNDMKASDRYIFVDDQGNEIAFFKNSGYPHYLETKRPGRREKLRNMRVTFYEVAQIVGAGAEAAVSEKGIEPVKEAQVITSADVGTVPADIVAPAKEEKYPGVLVADAGPAPAPEAAPANDDPKPQEKDYPSRGKWMNACKQWNKRNRDKATA